MKVVIVDDEMHARENLARRLEAFDLGISIVSTADNVDDGHRLILSTDPDLVFLDIEMPGEDGFALLDRFEGMLPFKVIFVTAYDAFALKAFEYLAIGYVTKPIDNDFLRKTVEHAISSSRQPSAGMQDLLQQIRDRRIRKVTVTTEKGFSLIPAEEVVLIESEDGYSKIYHGCGKTTLTSKRLKQYEEVLGDSQFYRVHRSYLVNIDHVVEYRKGGSIVLSNNMEITINKNNQKTLLEVLRSQ